MSQAVYKALFFGPFRVIVQLKEKEYVLDAETPTIHDLLKKIITDYPQLEEYFFQENQISENTSIIINGEDVRGGDGLKTVIKPEDRITFFKAAGGG
jgi:molybdopterin converting factor small subunit